MGKRILTFILIFLFVICYGYGQKRALLLIDIQDFYFPGGRSALVDPGKAAANAASLLDSFRKSGDLVIHVRHNSEPGGKISDIVKPADGERIFTKDAVNCFVNTGLTEYLKSNSIEALVICGMQTHMCVEAAVRAGTDLGYKCTLIHDACATRDLKFGDRIIKAEDVHYSTLAAMGSYARVLGTNEFLNGN